MLVIFFAVVETVKRFDGEELVSEWWSWLRRGAYWLMDHYDALRKHALVGVDNKDFGCVCRGRGVMEMVWQN